MVHVLITEKPSAARAFAKALGGMKGTFEGTPYEIVHARGHLYELSAPEEQPAGISDEERAKFKRWQLGTLPWDLASFQWKNKPGKDTQALLRDLKAALGGASTIVMACDVDPSGEGGLIAGNIIRELGFEGVPLERMYFLDEAEPSLQKAFRERKAIPSLDQFDEFRKASFRNRWDFASMQFTRVASLHANQRDEGGSSIVLRQGRLKSAMVLLVGAQLAAYNAYVKTVEYQNRFRDENGVMYTDPNEPIFPTEAEVPKSYSAGPVVLDKKTMKRTAPPKFLDLAALSARLGQKGYKAADVLKTYQALYEAQLASYPRTDDTVVSHEQWKEMLPLVPAIAQVIGVDPGMLTETSPRRTHVRDGGAHGANRPGTNVPASLKDVESRFGRLGAAIYEELGRSFLAALAPDYEYEAQEGHVEKNPTFVGRTSVPKVQGWKLVFNEDAEDGDEDGVGLGTTAEPIVFEVIPKRPEHPTTKWLMKQLERGSENGDGERTPIGTGATRTSTFAEVSNEKSKSQLIEERRGKLTLTSVGDMSHRMLPGTRIGDLAITAMVFDTMDLVAKGQADPEAELAKIAQLVVDDRVTMEANARTMRQALGLPEAPAPVERISGIFAPTGEEKSFKGVWGANDHWEGHAFTEEEAETLFAGGQVEFQAVSRAGNPYTAKGGLAAGTFNGRPTFGFKPDFGDPTKVPDTWSGYTFSDQEKADLEAGKKVFVKGAVSRKTGNAFNCTLSFKKEKGSDRKKLVPEFEKRK